MRKELGLLVILGVLAGSSNGGTCPPKGLSVTDPQSHQVSCLERWIPQQMIVVTEVECPPCQMLLKRMRTEQLFGKSKKNITLVWVETHPDRCLLEAQKFGALGKSVCTSARELEQKWAVSSTPTVFWTEKGVPRLQKGVVDTDKPLPWIIP